METHPLAGRAFFCSWSGGKDSALALHHAVHQGGIPRVLLTMMAEGGERSRSHGLPKAFLERQANSLGIPIIFRSASWEHYEDVFIAALKDLRAEGCEAGVFGDIDVEEHLAWVRRVCATAGIVPEHPLWQRERRGLLTEFVSLAYKATIVVLREDKLDAAFLGKEIDPETITALEQAGVDPAGELGEYHTAVTDGPLFSAAVPLRSRRRVRHEGYWFLEVA